MNRREFVGAGAAAVLVGRGRGIFGQSAEAVNAALVQTPLGPLRGAVIDGVRVFRGVPFAEPPVGALRFKPPVKVKPWVEEREASPSTRDDPWLAAASREPAFQSAPSVPLPFPATP